MRRLWSMDRRTFLKGSLGATLALPRLQAMAADEDATPLRYLACFGGHSLCTDTAVPSINVLKPTGTGSDYVLPTAGLPLSDIKSLLTVVSGLAIPNDNASIGNVPKGGRHGDAEGFHYHNNPFLTGNHQIGDELNMTVTGPSSDQVMADHHAGRTPVRGLVYRAQPGAYTGDTRFEKGLTSYRKLGDKIYPVEPQSNAREAWVALTGQLLPTGAADRSARLRDLERQRSVLDLVDRRMAGLVDKLGVADRQRLEQHYDAVRDLESRLQSPIDQTGQCLDIGDPGPDLGHQAEGYSQEAERAEVFHRLIQLAFSCDMTRSAMLMYTRFQSRVRLNGSLAEIHDIQHNGVGADLEPIVAWHMERWADLIRLLRDTPDGDGSLLDHTAVVYMGEGGFGTLRETVDTQYTSHSTEDMIWMLAGGAGGLRPKGHVVAPPEANHPANVLITAMAAAGYEANTLGEVEGEIPGLRS